MVDESIVNVIKSYLGAVAAQGIPVQCGVIFGSQVAGDSDFWSDIDLLVISPLFDEEHNRENINLLWRTAARTDSRIEPIPVGQRQFEQDNTSAIIETARREGKIVNLEPIGVSEAFRQDMKKAIETLSAAGCSEIYLFGSAASGELTTESDIDLAVRGCPPGKFFELHGQLLRELSRSVDLIN